MKSTNIIALLLSCTLLSATVACKKYYEPSTAKNEDAALSNADDVKSATIGTYAVLKNPNYVRSIHFLTEYQRHAHVSTARVLLWETCDLMTTMLHAWTKVRLLRIDPRLQVLLHQLRTRG